MRVFSIPGAMHFCGNFQAISHINRQSIEDINQQQSGNISRITEGNNLFDEYRASALRDTERNLFLAAVHYRRALELMTPSSSHWAHVTLYYGTWFAAHSLLGLFGCHVLRNHVIEVERSAPGSQCLIRRKIGNGQNQFSFVSRGSHQRFWEAFYDTVPHISRFADAQYAPTLAPVSNDKMWLIDQRNRINYRAVDGISLLDSFTNVFSQQSFPTSLPGELNTQYSICEGFLLVTYSFALQFGLTTDSLNSLGPQLAFKDKVRHHVYNADIPNVVSSTRGDQVFV